MEITKRSIYSGKLNTLDLPVTQEQIDKWNSGTLIQYAMPNLTPDQREFLITGLLPEEFKILFNEN